MNEHYLKQQWAERATKRQAKAERLKRARIKRERQMRAQGMTINPTRKRTLHFRWKYTGKGGKLNLRLYLCHGGRTIAAWPTGAEDPIRPLVQTKMIVEHESFMKNLSCDHRKVMSMARRLRKALVALEDGPRGKSISRQRRNLDLYCKFGLFRLSR